MPLLNPDHRDDGRSTCRQQQAGQARGGAAVIGELCGKHPDQELVEPPDERPTVHRGWLLGNSIGHEPDHQHDQRQPKQVTRPALLCKEGWEREHKIEYELHRYRPGSPHDA